MRYSLRTLLIVMLLGGPALTFAWMLVMIYMESRPRELRLTDDVRLLFPLADQSDGAGAPAPSEPPTQD